MVAILEAGNPLPFTIQAADLDLPELQGEPEDIAREKCRLAAEQVQSIPRIPKPMQHLDICCHSGEVPLVVQLRFQERKYRR